MAQSNVWTKEVVQDIKRKSREGKSGMRGFGTNRSVPGLDDLQIVPGQLDKPPYDKYREAINTQVTIGEGLNKPLVLDSPLMIAAMSFGAISEPGKLAFAYGAALTGIATNTGEGGMLDKEEEIVHRHGYDGKIVSQWSTGRFGVSADYLRASDAVEIKIGQGAKPGMGGHLMMEKITPKIASIRGLSSESDALSPCRHLDIDTPKDLKKHIAMIREVTNNEIPVIIKLGPGDVYEDVRMAVELTPDAIAVDGGEGGTGCAPSIVLEHAGVPTLGVFSAATQAFQDTRAREYGIKLIVSGGIRHGADAYKALALGADVVGIGTGAMVAIGCTGCQMCHTGTCPEGIATQKSELTDKLDWQVAGENLAQYLQTMEQEIITLSALSGNKNVNKLSKDDLVALNSNAADITGVKLMG